jgi:hypothetical protein
MLLNPSPVDLHVMAALAALQALEPSIMAKLAGHEHPGSVEGAALSSGVASASASPTVADPSVDVRVPASLGGAEGPGTEAVGPLQADATATKANVATTPLRSAIIVFP